MKPSNLILIAGLLISCLVFAAVPVSADTFVESYDDSQGKLTSHATEQSQTTVSDQIIWFLDYPDKAAYDGLIFWGYTSTEALFTSPIPEGETGIARIYSAAGTIAEGYFGSDYTYNALGGKTGGQFWINFYECNIDNIIAQSASFQIYYLNGTPAGSLSGLEGYVKSGVVWDNGAGFGLYKSNTQSISSGVSNIVYQSEWNSSIEATYNSGPISNVKYQRNGYYSSLNLTDEDGISFYYDYSNSNIDYDFAKRNYNFEITNPYGSSWFESLIAEEKPKPTVSVLGSVLSTADDALIGGATLNFNSTYQNVSQTLTNGYGLFTLYPDVEYTVSASADNYQEELSTNPTVTFHSDTPYDYYLKPVYGVENGTVQLNFYVSTANTVGSGYLKVPTAVISLNSEKTLITNSAGYAYTILNRSGSISYTITKSGYKTYSRSYTPNWETWSSDTFEEYIILLAEGATTGGVTPVPTPDTRTSNEKAESAFNILFDNVEALATMACIVLFLSFITWMTPKRR